LKGVPKLRFFGEVSSICDATPLLKVSGDSVLVTRSRPRLLLLSCPCGCGEHLPINLDSRSGPAWRIYRNKRKGISLFPSVWRESGCRSHFIIWNDKIMMLGQEWDDGGDGSDEDEILALADLVLGELSGDDLRSYFDLAEKLGIVPWDAQAACRRLVKMGLASEGKGKQRGFFVRKR
jgi:hypothetical protein